MALPPEFIEELMPEATAAVLAEVTKVLKQGVQKPAKADPRVTSSDDKAAHQVVELTVKAPVFGSLAAGATIEALKPEGDYALRPGNHGPFLLKQDKDGVVILGRYGPDTWPEAAVRDAAKKLKK